MLRIPYLLSYCFVLWIYSPSFAQNVCQTSIARLAPSGLSFASLPPELQKEARSTLQDLLDHEGLYTVFSDLKPMSTGFWSAKYAEADGEPMTVKNMRTILSTFQIDNRIAAGVLIFDKNYEGTRFAEGFVANLPALNRVLKKHAEFFQSLGLTTASTAQQIIEAVDRAEPTKRYRGFGLLFGYPQHAVDFFVAAHQQQQDTGKFVERDFFNVATFRSEKGAFVWAVPKGHIPNEADLEIQKQAQTVLEKYRRLRDIWTKESLPLENLVNYWLQPPGTESLDRVDNQVVQRHTAFNSKRNFPQCNPTKWRTKLRSMFGRHPTSVQPAIRACPQ